MPELAITPVPESSSHEERAGEYLIFKLARRDFGFPIKKVSEVMEMQAITRVPNAPAFLAGVINLRGKVIPVIDLRLTFGLQAAATTPLTCIVIARVVLASTDQVLGIIVDAVTDVIHLQGNEFLAPEEVQPVFDFGTFDPAPYLLGVARVEDGVKVLLDLDEVLNRVNLRQVPVLAAAS